jgi:energy-coupling factor transporter ATP-binding protein EcfA2
MRLRGLVLEDFGVFSRAEASLCDERGVPLGVALFVGESGSGKSTLLRCLAGVLAEASGRPSELTPSDIRLGCDAARCRIVFDDVAENELVKVTLERVVARSERGGDLRGLPPESYARWRRALADDHRLRAAISFAGSLDLSVGESGGEEAEPKPGAAQVAWLLALQDRPEWGRALRALDRVLWPYRLAHGTADRTLIFDGPERFVPLEHLGDGVVSAFVITVDLLRLSVARPDERIVYGIDDLDAHLDPRWQARILGALRKEFPHVQILATTSSPYVCASVEPRHVFRIQRAGRGRIVSRVADAVARSRTVSSVMELAFGAPELAGPRWVHDPPAEVRDELMRVLEPALPRGAIVYALAGSTESALVRDGFGDLIFAGVKPCRGHLFFVDSAPGQPWGHACEYVFRTGDGVLFRQASIWPPPELTERCVPIAYG